MASPLNTLSSLFKNIRQRRGGLPLMIIAVVVVVIYLLIVTRPRLEPMDLPERVWVVEAVTAQHRNIQPQLSLYGMVFAGRESDLRAQVSGNVVVVGEKYKEGGWVKAGDLLVQIDPFEYENTLIESRAQLAEARSKLDLLERDYVRAKELHRKKDASQQFLDTAELNLEQQKSIVAQREVGVKRAQRNLEQTKLLAPYDGVVDEVNAELGMRLSTNDKVALVIDTQRLEVRFSLSNAQFGRILDQDGSVLSRPVDITWQVGNKALNYKGSIERQGAQIASETGGVDMYAVINGSDVALATPLRPGAFVQVSVADRRYDKVLSIPEQALYQQNTLYIVKDDRLDARKVDIVGSNGKEILVRAMKNQTIADGELIVVTQIREGGAGIKVRVQQRTNSQPKPIPAKAATETVTQVQ
ncbi:efflux RND transporter periplasmic adaptor subunit [Oceanicoccus sagamiensis]|uniref:RND efflux pump membrane fusion protein barrel-sandwich domain-containing protein n=1 Tax=Oceanicoccus sagamiensis TaxID=716816 RepID=A0A1X9NDI3_9GAMM|nr:efflux RND transporter periplasmic adaptor subunit [Oceanicoccus sagamiensis]ARN73955.1 hypothetical protein BST96_07390 [Oceanicoccus sagamiensis]